MANTEALSDGFLCLKCRDVGHKASSCPKDTFLTDGDGLEWFFSTERDEESRRFSGQSSHRAPCERCKALNLRSWLDTLPPHHKRSEGLNEVYREHDDRVFRQIGTVSDIELHVDCDICICLFALIPATRALSQTVTLVLTWSAYRLENSISLELEARRTSSRCISAVLEPLETGAELHNIVAIGGDALSLSAVDQDHTQPRLEAVQVDPNRINITAVKRWLSTCDEAHLLTCVRPSTDKLSSARFIDTHSRRIVSYSSATTVYLTLSYVWGGVSQRFWGAGRPGTTLGALPRTIEDAIKLTQQLGKRYLWVDSVCINQLEWEDKKSQIAIMHEIYRGSFATIVALSGDDAEAGLARAASEPPTSIQFSCSLDGRRACTLGPTLTSLTSILSWGSRAWTYQEGLLSPRCIYITKYQVYFECNAMICCESISDICSPLHRAQTKDDYLHSETYTQQLNLGINRNPCTVAIPGRGDALNIYSLMSRKFSGRHLTTESDALAAYSGILQALEEKTYHKGFFWGMPYEALNWAMIWQPESLQSPKRSCFPTWSWLYNAGGMWPGGPGIGGADNDPNVCPFDLSLFRWTEYGLKQVFAMSYGGLASDKTDVLRNDPLANSGTMHVVGSLNLPSAIDQAQLERLIFFDSFAFTFAVDECFEIEGYGFHSFCRLKVDGQVLKGWTTYAEGPRSRHTVKQLWLLLARHIEGNDVVHWLILLKEDNGRYVRADMLRIEVPRHRLEVLNQLGVHRLRGALA